VAADRGQIVVFVFARTVRQDSGDPPAATARPDPAARYSDVTPAARSFRGTRGPAWPVATPVNMPGDLVLLSLLERVVLERLG
jgi:hypothetical protein